MQAMLAAAVLLIVLLLWVIARRYVRVFLGKQNATKPDKGKVELTHPSLVEEGILRVLSQNRLKRMSVREIGIALNLSVNDAHASLEALRNRQMVSKPDFMAQIVSPDNHLHDHRLDLRYRIERAGVNWLTSPGSAPSQKPPD